VATSDGEPVVCGGVQSLGPRTGEIKRMWVHPGWRGAGLGSRLLRHLEQVAAELGDTEVKLDTNGTLVEAIAMYERAGYRRIDRYNDNPYAQAWFAKELTGASA
jgi:ribosomal protein S18 acetylase RimI-like enzyme